jgi:hypothetical protein
VTGYNLLPKTPSNNHRLNFAIEPTMAYSYALGAGASEGTIHGITIKWQASAFDKLAQEASRTKQTRELLKALTENFVYLAALCIQSTTVEVT